MTWTAANNGRRVFARRQKGAAALVISLVLVVLTGIVAVYTGRTVLLERRISANDFRGRQAFEAADSGVQIALAYLNSPGRADKNGDGIIDRVFDTDGDGIGDADTVTFMDDSRTTVTLTGTFPAVTIQSVGVSDDQTASRTVRVLGSTAEGLPNPPDRPLTTRGTVTIDGSATVHNPEGQATIWSGSDVRLGSNNSTATTVADPNDPGYPGCMSTPMTCSTTRSSTKALIGADVIEHDSSLTNLTIDQMFENFFGTSMTHYRESRVTLEIPGSDANNLVSDATSPGIHMATGEIVWVEGNASLQNITTVGCAVPLSGASTCPDDKMEPSIVIVNGDLTSSGTPNFYGLLYVVGDIDLSGNMSVYGAVTVAGDVSSSTSGSLDIWYHSEALNRSRDNAPIVGAPGSWQDW